MTITMPPADFLLSEVPATVRKLAGEVTAELADTGPRALTLATGASGTVTVQRSGNLVTLTLNGVKFNAAGASKTLTNSLLAGYTPEVVGLPFPIYRDAIDPIPRSRLTVSNGFIQIMDVLAANVYTGTFHYRTKDTFPITAPAQIG